MENNEFVSLHTGSGKSVRGVHYFRKSAVTYFGIAEHRHGQDDPYFRAKITYATSASTADTFVLDMEDDIAFKEFSDQMLDTPEASAEELDKIRNGLLHADAPEKPEEEPAFVTRDCLEITEGSEEFFKWLHGKFYNGEKLDCWSFKAVPGTYDEDFIVCHKTNTSTSPADVHIAFRNHFKYAMVCGIVIMDHYTPDDVGFNIILHEFVRDILVPYALTHEITYSYAGTSNEHPMKSNGTPGNTITGTLDTLTFTEGVAGFYSLLLTREHFKDTRNWSVSRCLDNQFKCDFDDLNGGEESFSVYVQFKSDASYGAVTTVGATGNLSAEQYNRHLKRFVDEIVKPYAKIERLKYEYSGKC